MGNISVSRETILAALSKVQEPELHKDLVTLGMIQELQITGDTVSFTIQLTTPACPLRAKIESEARQAVKTIAGVERVIIKMDASVPSDGRPRGLLDLPVRNAVAIASGKGGVGKSTVAVNVAVSLAQSGARVGLLDADIYGPNVPTMMGLLRLPMPENNKLVPAEAYGVKVMSIGFLVKPGQPLIWRGPMLHSAIRQFLADVTWGELTCRREPVMRSSAWRSLSL
jgi:ATP-binding protein involved in chromosome partitioning